MKVFGRRPAAALMAAVVIATASAGTAAAKTSGKLPSDACKLLTLAQVQQVLPDAEDGQAVHDKADKEEICTWEVNLSTDAVQLTLRSFTGDATAAKAAYGTNDPDEKVKGLGSAAAFAPNDSDFTVRAVLGKVALSVKLRRDDYDVGNPADVAKLKSDATSVAKEAAKNL